MKKNSKKTKEVSAAGVVIYGNKVVVLYDKKYRHVVLPQGHSKVDESLIQAAKRELIEETGYTDMIYLKKLYSYQYHFLRGNQIVFKSVHVYLFKLQTAKKQSQALESHESYEARLVPLRSAVSMLHWPQDRLIIKKAIQEIKRGSVY